MHKYCTQGKLFDMLCTSIAHSVVHKYCKLFVMLCTVLHSCVRGRRFGVRVPGRRSAFKSWESLCSNSRLGVWLSGHLGSWASLGNRCVRVSGRRSAFKPWASLGNSTVGVPGRRSAFKSWGLIGSATWESLRGSLLAPPAKSSEGMQTAALLLSPLDSSITHSPNPQGKCTAHRQRRRAKTAGCS